MNARQKAKHYKRLLENKPLELLKFTVKESYYDMDTLTCKKCLTVHDLCVLGDNAVEVVKDDILKELLKNLDNNYIVYESEKTFDGEITVRATLRVLKPIRG